MQLDPKTEDYIRSTIQKELNSFSLENRPLTVKEAAAFLSITEETLKTYIKEGLVRSFKLKGKLYFFPEELRKDIKKEMATL